LGIEDSLAESFVSHYFHRPQNVVVSNFYGIKAMDYGISNFRWVVMVFMYLNPTAISL